MLTDLSKKLLKRLYPKISSKTVPKNNVYKGNHHCAALALPAKKKTYGSGKDSELSRTNYCTYYFVLERVMILSASDTAVESFEFLLGKFQLKNSVIDNFSPKTILNNILKNPSDFDQKGQNIHFTLGNTVFVKDFCC